MDLSEIESVFNKSYRGDTSVRLDETAVAPELRSCARLVNKAVDKIIEGQETKKTCRCDDPGQSPRDRRTPGRQEPDLESTSSMRSSGEALMTS